MGTVPPQHSKRSEPLLLRYLLRVSQQWHAGGELVVQWGIARTLAADTSVTCERGQGHAIHTLTPLPYRNARHLPNPENLPSWRGGPMPFVLG
jgi:hypothetical protein